MANLLNDLEEITKEIKAFRHIRNFVKTDEHFRSLFLTLNENEIGETVIECLLELKTIQLKKQKK